MNKNHYFYHKKTLSYFFVILLLGNFINFTVSLSCLSEEPLNLEQNSQDEFNSYIGTNCTKLGEYDSNYGVPYEMFITEHSSRTLAFIRENYGILVVDISDPEQPFFVNHYFEREVIDAFFVSDDYLFLVNLTDNLKIYNIQDIANPLLTFNGFINDTYYFTDLFVQDDILYAGVGYSGLAIYNLSNPWNPQFISLYQHDLYSDKYDDIVIRDNFAFLCRDNVFQIVNLTDIQNPNVSGIFLADRAYTDFRDIFISDETAYICADGGCFYILNISDLTNPTQITYIWDDSKYFVDFYPDGSIGYLLSNNEGLTLVNLTYLHHIEYIHKEYNQGYYRSLGFHAGHPILLDSTEGLEIYKVKEDYTVELISRFWDGGYGIDVIVSGDHAFVANSYNGLEIYKIRNVLTPKLKSKTYLGFQCQEIFLHKNLVYTISYLYDELYTIDVSNKRNPKILSVQSLLLEIDNVTYQPLIAKFYGELAFVAYYRSYQRYVAILDLANSSNYKVTELLPFNSFIYHVFYESPYLYVATSSREFEIYSHNETGWEFLSEFILDDGVRDLFIYENFAYIATYNDLIIYNFTNPLAPTETAIFHGSNSTYEGYDKVFVESDVAYLISENNDDIHFVNIQDKEHPYMEGLFRCNESLSDLFVLDHVVYLTSNYVNLEIIQLDRFISILNYIIYSPLAGIAAIIGIPIIIVVFVRAKRRRVFNDSISTTQMLPREELQDPSQNLENGSTLSISLDDYDDPKLYALAKKIVETAEKDSK